MDVRHDDASLERLEDDAEYNAGLGAPLVSAFRRQLSKLRRVSSLTELRNWQGFGFEKLKGDLKDYHAIRLNGQWRLLLDMRSEDSGVVLVVKEIIDYHS